MSNGAADKHDHWDSFTYSQKVAPYVPRLTQNVVQLLDPQPNDLILDLGCGDGTLTSQLSHRSQFILGIDSSPNLISAARTTYSTPNAVYLILDALDVSKPEIRENLLSHLPHDNTHFTKIFSNAALHWILRPVAPTNKNDFTNLVTFYKSLYNLLAPGGYIVTESGALGNVSDVHTALVSAMVHTGIPPERAREFVPWFFPSTALMKTVLEQAGFEVEVVEAVLRQTDMTENSVEGWVRLFAADILDKVEDWVAKRNEGDRAEGRKRREAVVTEVCEVLEGVGRRMEDGGFVLNYIRLRVKAKKPEIIIPMLKA